MLILIAVDIVQYVYVNDFHNNDQIHVLNVQDHQMIDVMLDTRQLECVSTKRN